MTEEEWGSSPRLEQTVSSYRDFLSDITSEEGHGRQKLQKSGVGSHGNGGRHDQILELESVPSGPSPRQQQQEDQMQAQDATERELHRLQQEQRQRRQQKTREEEEDAFPKAVSPFSPELRQKSRRRRRFLQQPTIDNGPQPARLNVTWDETAARENYSLSLADDRIVSVVIHVSDPPPKTEAEEKQGRLPCVFPLEAFSKSKSSSHEASSKYASSPTKVALYTSGETRRLMVINPSAFGKHVPKDVSMDIMKQVVGRSDSEDWAREYRFNQVLWPSGSLTGLLRMAQAISQDLTAPASIAHRTVFSYGQEDKQYTLFGTCINDSVAQSFAAAHHAPSSGENSQEMEYITERYGLAGLTLQDLLRFKLLQNESKAEDVGVGLSLIEVTGEESFQDLSTKWTDRRAVGGNGNNNNNNKTGDGGPRLRLIYDGESNGGVISGIRIHEVDSLKTLGHCLRRAFKVADFPKRGTKRGHIIASLYLYRSGVEFGSTDKQPVAHFVDLATPTAIDLSKSATNGAGASKEAETRRNRAVRTTVTTLGAVLRACLLREAGNAVTLSFRESTLTKVLQKSIDHQDGKTILLTSISPMTGDYSKTMEYLRYSNRLLETTGEPPKSPFNTLNKLATGPGSVPTSPSSDSGDQISVSGFDPKYEAFLLQTVTSDARQRLSKAGFHPNSARNVVFVKDSSEGTAPTTTTEDPNHYEELDPGDFDGYNGDRTSSVRPVVAAAALHTKDLPMSLLPTPRTYNLKKRPLGVSDLDTSFPLESTAPPEQYSDGPHNAQADMFPSPITTDTGNSRQPEAAEMANSLLGASEQQQQEDKETLRSDDEEERSDPPTRDDKNFRSQLMPEGVSVADYEKQMDELSAELRRKAALEPVASSATDDQAMDDLSLELKARLNRPDQERPVQRDPSPHNTRTLRYEARTVVSTSSSSNNHINANNDIGARAPSSSNNNRNDDIGARAPSNRNGVPVVEDVSETDTVSQVGEIDATYSMLSKSAQNNAESMTQHLRVLKESEQSIIKRIAAERDSMKLELDRLAKERERDAMNHERELQLLRRNLDSSRKGREDLEEIAEEAVGKNEELGKSIEQLESRLRRMQDETVSRDSVQQLQSENVTLSGSLRDVKFKLHQRDTELSTQEQRIGELQDVIRKLEQESEQFDEARRKDAEKLREMEEQLRSARSTITSLHTDVARSNRELEHTKHRFAERETELTKALEEAETSLETTRREKRELASALEEGRGRQGELQRDNDRLRREVVTIQQVARRDIQVRDEQVEQMKTTVTTLSKELEARAADVTELVQATEALEEAKRELRTRLQEERSAKEKADATAKNLQATLEKLMAETRKRFEPLVENRKQERANLQNVAAEKEVLRVENEELAHRNQQLQLRIERMLQELREHDRLVFEREGELLYRGPPLHQYHDSPSSKEQLENLALDLSLIVRDLPYSRHEVVTTRNGSSRSESGGGLVVTGGGGIGNFDSLESHIQATERITTLLLQTVRQHVRDLRKGSRNG